MMDTGRKEKIREGIRNSGARYTRKQVAENVGCAQQTLSTFMHGGPLGSGLQDAAETWLRNNGFWPDDQQKPAPVNDPCGE